MIYRQVWDSVTYLQKFKDRSWLKKQNQKNSVVRTFHILFEHSGLGINYQSIYMVVLRFSGPSHQDKMSRYMAENSYCKKQLLCLA